MLFSCSKVLLSLAQIIRGEDFQSSVFDVGVLLWASMPMGLLCSNNENNAFHLYSATLHTFLCALPFITPCWMQFKGPWIVMCEIQRIDVCEILRIDMC